VTILAFCYARVSTLDKEQDPAPQVDEMREYCDRQGWRIQTFVDRVSSGKHRPEFERMMKEIRRGRGQVLLCRHFDRIARSARELVMLADELIDLNVRFISLNQQLDTRTAMGKFCFTVIAAAAELERGMIRERVRLGLAAARNRGKRLGRPPVPVDLSYIARRRAQNASLRVIARELMVSERTLRRALKTAA